MRSGLEAPYIPTSLIIIGTGLLQSVVSKGGAQKCEVPCIPFSLIAGSLKRGYLLYQPYLGMISMYHSSTAIGRAEVTTSRHVETSSASKQNNAASLALL